MSNEEKLTKMLKYVSKHNDFYKNRIKEYGIKDPLDITQWPILTRKELQENRYNMFSDGYKTKYFNQQLRRQSSSGSTGVPINVYWDYKDWYASNMCLWRKRLQWYDIKPTDKYVIFTLDAYSIKPKDNEIYYVNSPSNVLSINSSLIQCDIQYRKVVELINEFDPKWLYVQPFVLAKLIDIYKFYGYNIPSNLRNIESVGEILTNDLKKHSLETFHISPTNMYGSEEMNCIALETPNGNMLIMEDNVYIEVENNKITRCGDGKAVITSLNNYAMPLIRYNQGDMINIEPRSDDHLYINTIYGRTCNCIKTGNGSFVSAIQLLEIISEVNNVMSDVIKENRFIYNKKRNEICCYVILNPTYYDWKDNVALLFKNICSEKIIWSGNINIQFCEQGTLSKHTEKKEIILFEE